MRSLKTKIRGLNKQQYLRLKDITGHAKNLYNQALWTLMEAFEVTGIYFSYLQMDKVMKQVKNLEGEVNYKLLKAKVAQQTLRRLDKNFKSFFRANQDFQKNPSKYKGKPKPPRFKKTQLDNLVFDYQAFKILESVVVLKDNFQINDIYQIVKPATKIEQVKLNKLDQKSEFESKELLFHNNVMSIDLGLNNLATCVTNGVMKPFIIDGRRFSRQMFFLKKHLPRNL